MVKFAHYRRRNEDGSIASRGGVTIAYLAGEAGVSYAKAQCTDKDNYCRAYGRNKAAGRLASARYQDQTDLQAPNFLAALDDRLETEGYFRA